MPKGGRKAAQASNERWHAEQALVASTLPVESPVAVPAASGDSGVSQVGARTRVPAWVTTERLAWLGAVTGSLSFLYEITH